MTPASPPAAPPTPSSPPLVIRPAAVWPSLQLAEIWEHWDLLRTLASRDVKLRYRQTALGVSWVVIQPLLAAAVLGFVFGRVAKVSASGTGHFLFAFVGFLAWSAFTAAATRSAPSLLQNATLVSRVYFPRLLLPVAASLSSLLDAAIGLVVAVVIALWTMGGVPLTVAAAPVFIMLAGLLGAGLGIAGAALAVSYRDVQHVLPVFVQLTLFASPVAYPVSAVPAEFRSLYLLNPLAGLIDGLRWSLLGGVPGAWSGVLYAAVTAVACFAAGVYCFRLLDRGFADVI